MKKLLTAFFLLVISYIYGLPVNNPAGPSLFLDLCDDNECCDLISFEAGYYGDYVFNRHMQTVHDRDIDTTQLFTNAAYFAVNFYEFIDVFATLGASRLALNTSLVAFNVVDPHPLFEVESETAFSYSIGARATLYEYGCASLGIMGQYFETRPRIKRMYIAAGAVSYPDDVLQTHYHEWQLGTGISYRYNDFFVPYIAVKYANSFWKLDNGQRFIIETNTNTFLFNLRNQMNWGYAIGLTLCPPICEKLIVTVEARFPDEKAFYVNGQVRF